MTALVEDEMTEASLRMTALVEDAGRNARGFAEHDSSCGRRDARGSKGNPELIPSEALKLWLNQISTLLHGANGAGYISGQRLIGTGWDWLGQVRDCI